MPGEKLGERLDNLAESTRRKLNQLRQNVTKAKQTSGSEQSKEVKETKNVPGKFYFEKKMKDNQGRNRKIYSYTFLEGGDDRGIARKYEKAIDQSQSLLPSRNFCDKNGNPTKTYSRESCEFNKGETVYIRVPDKNIVDNIPEMTMDDINRLPDNEIKKIFDSFEVGGELHGGRGSIYEHEDKNGKYIIVRGKKLYEQYLAHNKIMKSKKPCVLLEWAEGGRYYMAMGRYDGKVFHGIDTDSEGNVLHRGNIKLDEEWYR